jgi:hypothetical protein
MKSEGWLLLLYELPARRNSARVNLWRQLKKSGALPLKTSASLLPDAPGHAERFQWLAQEVRDGGGEATLVRVSEVEGLSHDEIARLFNEARAKDYEELIAELTALLARKRAKAREPFHGELEKLGRRLEGIRRLDFFNCPRAQDAQTIMQRARGLRAGKGQASVRLSAKRFLGRTWLTRPRPEIDRVGSAWLIRRFIDPKARFIFANDPKQFPKAIPYDMAEVDFSHHGNDCTFETLIKRFRISDKAALQIAEMVHEADLEDEKFPRKECVGLDRLLKGWARLGLSDEELLKKGSECFDALYEYIRK